MENFLDAARILIAIDIFAAALVAAILLLAAPIFGMTCYVRRWRMRVRQMSPYATSAPFYKPERPSRT